MNENAAKTESAVKEVKDEIAADIRAIKEIKDRLEWIHSVAFSCDMDTHGAMTAFIDAVRDITGTDSDVMGDIMLGLKRHIGFNGDAGKDKPVEKQTTPKLCKEFIDKYNALAGENPTHEIITDPNEKVVSYSLWREFYDDVDQFVEKVRFLSWAGYEVDEEKNMDTALMSILDVSKQMREKAEEYHEKMKEETRHQVKKKN